MTRLARAIRCGATHETHLPAQRVEACPHPRFPCPHEDCGWSQGPVRASRQGSQAADPVTISRGRLAAFRAAAPCLRVRRVAERLRAGADTSLSFARHSVGERPGPTGFGGFAKGQQACGRTQPDQTDRPRIVPGATRGVAGTGCAGDRAAIRSRRRQSSAARGPRGWVAKVEGVEAEGCTRHNRRLTRSDPQRVPVRVLSE